MLLLVVIGSAFFLSFALACGLGANDVSNAFATSIGAKVLSLRNAFIIASIAEIIGSIALGGLVTEKIIKATLIPGVLTPGETILAMEASLFSVALWLGLATFLKLPVSATHAVVSAMIGAGMMANSSAVCWPQLLHMALAWVLAPVLAGIFSSFVHILLNRLILTRSNPVKAGLFAIPFIYSLTIGVNASMIGYQLIHKLSLSFFFIAIILTTIVSITIATLLLSRIFLVPWTRLKIEKNLQAKKIIDTKKEGFKDSLSPLRWEGDIDQSDNENGSKDVEKLFSILQVLSAIFTSFAHGSNDVSNSIGPLFGLLNAYRTTLGLPPLTSDSLALYGLLAFGGVGMVVGLFTWGARVIETLGTRLTSSISPSKGFSIELGSALTVLGASIAGLSVSTTHCKVGAIVAIGLTANTSNNNNKSSIKNLHLKEEDLPTLLDDESQLADDPIITTTYVKEISSAPAGEPNVNWRLIGDIFASWICTIPFASLLAAGFYFCFSKLDFLLV